MIATAIFLFLIGIFIVANAGNLVGVFKGDKKITVFTSPTTSKTTGTTNKIPEVVR